MKKNENIISLLSISIIKATMSSVSNCSLKTYRYIFAQEFIDELSLFSKIHQYDDRIQFKEAWQLWIADENYANIIKQEVERLTQLGYNGDIMKKMFHSARFYYRKKPLSGKKQIAEVSQNIDCSTNTLDMDNSTEKSPIKFRFDKEFLKAIDAFILESIMNKNQESNNDKIELSPADSYICFNDKFKSLIDVEIQRLNTIQCITEKSLEINFNSAIIVKLKKTYKNRFYNIKSKFNILKV